MEIAGKGKEGVTNMRRIAMGLILVIVAVVISSCASKKAEEVKPPAEADDEVASGEAAPQEGPVFTYDDAKIIDQAQEICLTFSDEPVQLPGVGFIKLKGIILGKEPMALVDVGGRGIMVAKGGRAGEYVVAEIREGFVRLEKIAAPNANVGTGFIPERTGTPTTPVGTGFIPVRHNNGGGEQNE